MRTQTETLALAEGNEAIRVSMPMDTQMKAFAVAEGAEAAKASMPNGHACEGLRM